MLLFRPPLMKFGLAGVRPANFAALGTDPSPLSNDLPSLGDRANAEWLWALLPPLPASGTTGVDDRGGYELVAPADGVYAQDYRGLVMPSSGAPQEYTATITTTVGAGAPSYIGAAASMSAAASLSAASGIYTAASGPASYVGVAAALSAAPTLSAGTGTYTAPIVDTTTEPVTLSQAKLAARLNDTETELDPVVLGYISTARQIAEHETGRTYVQQTRRYTFADWPAADHVMHVHQATAVVVSWWDGAQWVSMPDTDFAWGEVDLGTAIAPALGRSWPTLGDIAIGKRVRVDITAGTTTPTLSTPECVKTFIKACVSWWVDNPDQGATASLQEAPRLMRLLDPERLWGA